MNPLAYTVPHDVEAIWVLDDRDSRWSDLAPDAKTTFPAFGTIPGVNDQFNLRPGVQGFFAFNDYHADYWFVTGVPVPASPGGTSHHQPRRGAAHGGWTARRINPSGAEQRRFRDPDRRQRQRGSDHSPPLPQCRL